MTPAPPQLAPPRARIRAILTAVLGVVLLAALFLPARDPVTHRLAAEWRPSAELAGVLFLIAMAALASPRLVAGRGFAFVLALLVVGAALLNLADAATPSLLGRDLNLYWDLQHFPSLFGLARDSAGLWSASVAAALLVAAVSLVVAGAYWIWRRVLATLADRRIAIGAAVLLGVALDVTSFLPAEQRPLATGLGTDIVRHAAAFERGWRAEAEAGVPLPAALASSGPPGSNLTGLKRRDVYLVYIESYGTTVFDTPEFRSALRGPLIDFEVGAARSRLHDGLEPAGVADVRRRVLAGPCDPRQRGPHGRPGSLLPAVPFRPQDCCPATSRMPGWRAIEIMPGIKAPDPEARAWGFDRDVYAAELGYHGPSFGWFAIPDQFTLERAAEIREALGSETPVFTQIVLVSSHIPFSPVPPYLADWRDAGAFATVPADAWEEIFRPPDWTVLAPGYLKSLKYDFAVLGDWLAKHLPGDGLVILLGDHQPPAVVGGELQQWTVPVHVLSRDPDLVAPFIAAGYVAGLVPPPTPPPKGMETFLPSFLAAFDRSD